MENIFYAPVELRAATDPSEGPGRLVAVLMRYGERAQDRPEIFAPGSLAWPDAGVIMNEQHNRLAPIMRVLPEDRDGSLVIDQRLPNTQRGNDAATMIRDGTLTGLSAEFRALSEDRLPDGTRRITSGQLVGIGLVDSPSYRTSVEVRAKAGKRKVRWL